MIKLFINIFEYKINQYYFYSIKILIIVFKEENKIILIFKINRDIIDYE